MRVSAFAGSGAPSACVVNRGQGMPWCRCSRARIFTL